MNWEQIAKRWRENFVAKLQERYGLRDEEARMKADAWLQWLGQQSHLIPQTLGATEAEVQRAPSRNLSRQIGPKGRRKPLTT